MTWRAFLLHTIRFVLTGLAVADARADVVANPVGLASGWTPIKDGDDQGQLLVDVTNIRLWRKVELNGWFQFIPRAHTMDEKTHKRILYELHNDAFNCSERTASRPQLFMFYEDGTQRQQFPWGKANPWKAVIPGTMLDSEMKFVCATRLTSDPSPVPKRDEGRLFGTWRVEAGARGRIAGPIVISKQQIAWTGKDKHTCVVNYRVASQFTGSTFPGSPIVSNRPNDAYTTFVLQLGEHHCERGMAAFTVTFRADQLDLAHFAAFFGAVQGFGTMRQMLQEQ
jgi:hypothetical protein